VPLEKVHDLVKRAGVPTVVFAQPKSNPLLPAAVLNFAPATEEAIDHLMGLGHRRIGTITQSIDAGLDVTVGWGARFMHSVLRARGLETNSLYDWVVHSAEDCTQLVQERFMSDQHPTALLVRPLSLVSPTIAGLRAAGVRLPGDVSLIGFGDGDWTQIIDPPLSVIAADVAAHLDAATRLLLQLIEHKDDPVPGVEHLGRYIRRGTVWPPPDNLQGKSAYGVTSIGNGEAAK
jgi:LacI family transcriptional regulator